MGQQLQPGGRDYKQVAVTHEYLLVYSKSDLSEINEIAKETEFTLFDNKGGFIARELRNRNPKFHSGNRSNLFYPFYVNPSIKNEYGYCAVSLSKNKEYNVEVKPYNSERKESVWRWRKDKAKNNIIIGDLDKSQIMAKQKRDGNWNIYEKNRKDTTKVKSLWNETEMRTENGTREIRELFETTSFDHPKPLGLLTRCLQMGADDNDLILDFFAGSGTTAHAVMQLNAEENRNLKFILCQIDEPIAEDKPAYQFCVGNNLPPVISSITIERLRRAGEKIKSEVQSAREATVGELNFDEADTEPIQNADTELSRSVDVGFKVFDLTDAPKLEVAEDGQISIQNTDTDPLSRIYNMIFSVGVDNPTSKIETVLENCLYRIGKNHYITNAEILDEAHNKHHLTDAIKNGNVYIDGWTASINTTLQTYKDDIKIVF